LYHSLKHKTKPGKELGRGAFKLLTPHNKRRGGRGEASFFLFVEKEKGKKRERDCQFHDLNKFKKTKLGAPFQILLKKGGGRKDGRSLVMTK